METKAGGTQKVEVHEMSIDEDQVQCDWEAALGVGEVEINQDAKTIVQLCALLGWSSTNRVARWAERGVENGTVERVTVYRDTGSGMRRQKAYRIIK